MQTEVLSSALDNSPRLIRRRKFNAKKSSNIYAIQDIVSLEKIDSGVNMNELGELSSQDSIEEEIVAVEHKIQEGSRESKYANRDITIFKRSNENFAKFDHLTFGQNGSDSRTSMTYGDDKTPIRAKGVFKFDSTKNSHEEAYIKGQLLKGGTVDLGEQDAPEPVNITTIPRSLSQKINSTYLKEIADEIEVEQAKVAIPIKYSRSGSKNSPSKSETTSPKRFDEIPKGLTLSLKPMEFIESEDETLPRFASLTTLDGKAADRQKLDKKPSSIKEESEERSSSISKFEKSQGRPPFPGESIILDHICVSPHWHGEKSAGGHDQCDQLKWRTNPDESPQQAEDGFTEVKTRNREHSSSSPDLTNEVLHSENYTRIKTLQREKSKHASMLTMVDVEIKDSVPRSRLQLKNPFVWEDDTKSEFSEFSEMKANRLSPTNGVSPMTGGNHRKFKLILEKGASIDSSSPQVNELKKDKSTEENTSSHQFVAAKMPWQLDKSASKVQPIKSTAPLKLAAVAVLILLIELVTRWFGRSV